MNYKRLILVVVLCFPGIISMAQTKTPSAEIILKSAYDRAGKEHKKVFVIFRASWCGWCHKMDSSMNDKSCRKFFDDNYIICHLTVDEAKGKEWLENPGATELRNKYNGTGSGIPFWLVLDQNARLLADSKMRPDGAGFEIMGDNSGCPASKAEVAYFLNVLRKTSRLTASELSVVAKRFSKNAVN
ncbi:MAG: thioredoxin family protein [Ferruginibacter sp.]